MGLPQNWEEVSEVMIYDKEKALYAVLKAEHCMILDTCAVMQFAKLESDPFFTYIRSITEVVLVTRTVLMELLDTKKRIGKSHIDFFRKLNGQGLQVCLFDEEWCLDYLKCICTKSERELNWILVYAIRKAAGLSRCVSKMLCTLPEGKQKQYLKEPSVNESYTAFFKWMREHKAAGDSMGEEMILLAVTVMASVREGSQCKYIVLGNDRRAIPLSILFKKYIKDRYGWDALIHKTTCSLGITMFREGVMDSEQLLEFIRCSYPGQDKVRCYCLGSDDFEFRELSVMPEELVEIVEKDVQFRILY